MSTHTTEFKFSCPSCGQHISTTQEYAGVESTCPTCSQPFVVPVHESTEIPPDLPALKALEDPKQTYWYGYVYAALWAYVTYSCLTHLLATILAFRLPHPGDPAADASFWTQAVLWPAATAAFAWVTYRLVMRRVSMAMIYVLVGVHGLTVLMHGIVPKELVFYFVLSYIAVVNFKSRLKPVQ